MWHQYFYWYQQSYCSSLSVASVLHYTGISSTLLEFVHHRFVRGMIIDYCPFSLSSSTEKDYPWAHSCFLMPSFTAVNVRFSSRFGLSLFFARDCRLLLKLVHRSSTRCHGVRSSRWLLACGCRLSLMMVRRQSVRCRLVSKPKTVDNFHSPLKLPITSF